MRTFVAIELTQQCRDNLLEAIDTLDSIAGGVKWSDEKKLHLTVKFIGELDEDVLPDAIEALQKPAEKIPPFSMDISGISGFPPKGPKGVPNVLFAAVQEDSGTLQNLQSSVEDALAEDLGLEREDRDYIPHVTLGRVKEKGFCPPLPKLVKQLPDSYFGKVPVSQMALIKSELTRDGPIYTPLHEFTLQGEE